MKTRDILLKIGLVCVLCVGMNYQVRTTATVISFSDVNKNISLLDFFDENNLWLNNQVNLWYKQLTRKERVSQLVMVLGQKADSDRGLTHKWIADKLIGGVALWEADQAGEHENTVLAFNQLTKNVKGVPLLFAVDGEPSLMNSRFPSYPQVNRNKDITNQQECKEVAGGIATFLKVRGIHQTFAPVCDVNLGLGRSFNKPMKTYIVDFIEATQKKGIVATAKHFPGFGYVKGGGGRIFYIDGVLKELPVFQEAINAGVIAVMTAHVAVRNNASYNTGEYMPASLSPVIIKHLLKQEMGFEGIAISDVWFEDKVNLAEVGVQALEAGNDLLLIYGNPTDLVSNIQDKMSCSLLLAKQLEVSIKKILRLKVCLGLYGG